ncbi:hypothetical protein GIB67_012427 [Kingdonia uniflora]|uniref:CCHC-type domain-containing protein n=1 Tax=Kingdonia uniflora TaxID=39325 RepID=A0A7J7LM60_9MAGN|nr:hypothetical protein GIB67_012427 [Kingdonia uniflora]
MQRDICFNCKRVGHWSRYCPDKLNNNKQNPSSSSAGSPIIDDLPIPDKQCPCGLGMCNIRTATTYRNYGRKFYGCPGWAEGDGCNFFKWCDTVNLNQRRDVPKFSYFNDVARKAQRTGKFNYSDFDDMKRSDEKCNSSESSSPVCGCGAGPCTLITKKDEENKNRKCFVCPIKKLDSLLATIDLDSPISVLNGQVETKETENDLHTDGDINELAGSISTGLFEEALSSPLYTDFPVRVKNVKLDFGVKSSLFPELPTLSKKATHVDLDSMLSAKETNNVFHTCGNAPSNMEFAVKVENIKLDYGVDNSLVSEMGNLKLSEEAKPVGMQSPLLTLDGRVETKKRKYDHHRDRDCNELIEIISTGQPEKVLNSPLYPEVLANAENVKLDYGANSSLFPEIGNLTLSEKVRLLMWTLFLLGGRV